jgi:hypothetical protein
MSRSLRAVFPAERVQFPRPIPPGSGSAPRVRGSGRTRITKVRLSAEAMRTEFVCIPRPITRSEKPDGGLIRYRVFTYCRPLEERRAPQLKTSLLEGDAGPGESGSRQIPRGAITLSYRPMRTWAGTKDSLIGRAAGRRHARQISMYR